MNHRVLAVLLVSLAIVHSPVVAAPGYDLAIQGSIDTPDRVVSHQDSSYTISSIAVKSPGESVTISVTKPNIPARVYAYRNDNGAKSIQDSEPLSEDETTATFNTDRWQSGSYLFAIYANSTHQAVHPLVLEGYGTTLNTPSATGSHSKFDVSLALDPKDRTAPPHSVEFVFANDSTQTRVTGTQVSEMEYSGTVSIDEFAPGKYRLYAVVYSSESTPSGGNEIVAVSQPDRISIDSELENGSNGGMAETKTHTTTITTPNKKTSGTPPTPVTSTTRTTPSDTISTQQSTTTESSNQTATTDDVIMPATSTKTTSTSTPAFPANTIVALAVLILILRWR